MKPFIEKSQKVCRVNGHIEANFIIKDHGNANEMIQLQSKLPVMKI